MLWLDLHTFKELKSFLVFQLSGHARVEKSVKGSILSYWLCVIRNHTDWLRCIVTIPNKLCIRLATQDLDWTASAFSARPFSHWRLPENTLVFSGQKSLSLSLWELIISPPVYSQLFLSSVSVMTSARCACMHTHRQTLTEQNPHRDHRYTVRTTQLHMQQICLFF